MDILKIKSRHLDTLILTLLSYVVLVDMINGFFMMHFNKLPISQIFKLLVLLLLLFRLSVIKEFPLLIILFCIFQIGAFLGLAKTGDFGAFRNDLVVATKWFNVPLSFFFFKNVFQNIKHNPNLLVKVKKVIKRSFTFLSINMFLGALGFGMAFYHHGFSNAIGTRGYIYAGNELTILLLAISFSIALYLYLNQEYKRYALFFGVTVLYAFLITSKTVLGGVIVVFLIPPMSQIKFRIKKKWLDYLLIIATIGIPLICYVFYLGITRFGVLDKIQRSMERNNNEILTVILSNRNNFIAQGWEVYKNDFGFFGKLFGFGQNYHLKLSGHLAEVDFFSLLFASGALGLISLVLLILYWVYSAYFLGRKGNEYAKAVLWFLLFITIASNLSGHIYGSGIAGYFIGFSIALMFYKKPIGLENKN